MQMFSLRLTAQDNRLIVYVQRLGIEKLSYL